MSDNSLLRIYTERVVAKAISADAGELEFLDAVDQAQELAEQYGLIEAFDQDQIQKFLSDVFATGGDVDIEFDDEDELPNDEECCPTCGSLSCVNPSFCALSRECDARHPPPKPYKPSPRPVVAASTLDAFRYLVRQRDSERLRLWLARHSPEEVAALQTMITIRELAA